MSNLVSGIEEILLMGPGPSNVPGSVYDALCAKTMGYLDPYFITIMDAIKEKLQAVLKTKNALTIPVSGTGSAGMETCFVNLIEPGDPVLIMVNGLFGLRMKEVATRLGAQVDALEFEWGKPVVVDDVARKISEKGYKIVAVVHAETSTGVANPIEKIGALLKGTGSLYLVDAVTSLGGMEVEMDRWRIDALYSCSQKCLSCPPGLAPISFSDRAQQVLKSRKSRVQNFYFDLSLIMNYWSGQKREYHHTAPINMLYALYQALDLLLQEGLDNAFKRHLTNHLLLVREMEKIGLEMLVERGFRLPMLNAVKIPQGIEDAPVRARLRNEHKIEIGAGLGPLAGKIWRIGLMGYTARQDNVLRLIDALESIL